MSTRKSWKSGMPSIARDPIELAVEKIEHHPDPKMQGVDVSEAADKCREYAGRDDVPEEVKQQLLVTADYLSYYQVMLMKASRTVFRAVLVMGLLLTLVIVMLVNN
jgi:isoleucyl-tRNA synthetase